MTTWYDQIENIQLDVTSYCNAKCVSCVRNLNGSINVEGLKLEHLSVDIIKRMFHVDLRDKYINLLSFNGVYGDACMHPDLIEIIDIIQQSHPEAEIAISTNGSLRTTKWWTQLADSLNKFHKSFVIFAVDGLEDTHHIYRRNTDFNKIIDNMRAFISAAGNAKMITTVFDHNKHQLLELKKLAEEMGCHSHTTRRSFTTAITVFDDEGNRIPNAVPITAPDLGSFKKLVNFPANMEKRKAILKSTNKFVLLKNIDVSNKKRPAASDSGTYKKCRWYTDERMIQIDPWGYVWPCCWIGKNGHDFEEHLKKHGHKFDHAAFLERNIDFRKNRGYEFEFHNLHNNSLETILKGSWFNNTLPNSFTEDPMHYCIENCGVGKQET